MKLKYNGMVETRGRAGCRICGGGGAPVKNSVATTKRFVLPSGTIKTFRIGETYEVSDKDAEFLRSYGDNGRGEDVFEAVQ